MNEKKNSGRKVIVLVLVLSLLLGCAVGGTVAWLMTKTEPLVNTFTTGKITLTVTEPGFDSVATNKTLKFLPGETFTKDPTITVEKGSAPCYVRAFVVIWWDISADPNFDAEDGADWFQPQTVDNGYLTPQWLVGYNDGCLELYDNSGEVRKDGQNPGEGMDQVLGIVMEYRWNGVVDAGEANQVLWPLFGAIKVPGDLTSTQYTSLDNFKLTVLAQAVQAHGVTDKDGDSDVDVMDAFNDVAVPEVFLEHCVDKTDDTAINGQTLARIIEKLQAQSNSNDNVDKDND